MVNTFTKSLTKLTMMLSACEPIKAAPSETLHQKKITGKLTAEEYGIIPAYAGSTICRWLQPRRRWDHPRVCGEHTFSTPKNVSASGSSPRMRGALPTCNANGSEDGIIPAYAGSTFRCKCYPYQVRDHPRVCGEHRMPPSRLSRRMRRLPCSASHRTASCTSEYRALASFPVPFIDFRCA